jgi:hypothetical protein
MGKMKFLTLLIPVVILLSCCRNNSQDEPRQIEYMIFGHYYGECAGKDCIKFFKIDCCQIFEDTSDIYPDIGLELISNFNKELNPKELDSVNFLIHRIPHVLFFEKVKVIGVPDANDQGGLYVEVKCAGEPAQFWYIDQMKTNIPEYLHPFVDDINKAIALLK